MANIATVAVAAFVATGVTRGRVTAHGLLRAMTRFYGCTYWVPTWTYDDYPRGCIYVQYGEKWSPIGVIQAWERYGRFLDAIWVRWNDSGSDHDAIFRTNADDSGAGEQCRYWFDKVRVYAAEGFDLRALGGGGRLVRPGVWEVDCGGSYLASNGRSDLGSREYPALPSRTTRVCVRHLGRGPLGWSADEMPAEVAQLEPVILSAATGVEFFWHGRATRLYSRRAEFWGRWCLDDWDNCAHPDWVADRAAREGLGVRPRAREEGRERSSSPSLPNPASIAPHPGGCSGVITPPTIDRGESSRVGIDPSTQYVRDVPDFPPLFPGGPSMPDEQLPFDLDNNRVANPGVRRPVPWVRADPSEQSPENWVVYKASVDGARWAIRMNDFPAEPLYTLLINETPIMDFEDWPSFWTRPA
jgi:hypothetical protein